MNKLTDWLTLKSRQFLLNLLERPISLSSFDNCTGHETARLYSTARIYNIRGSRSAIEIGKNTHVRGELLTFAHGGAIRIGEYCYIGEGTRIWSSQQVTIGDRVLISHNVNIFDSDTHPIDDPVARHEQFKAIITTGHPADLCLNEAPVHIADDVLIGCQVIVISGVTIGRGAVVGAGSVVTRDVPEYSVMAGNPAKVVRKILR
jgi:acetyltransferase-like isoleucine patch superfamily enzyme